MKLEAFIKFIKFINAYTLRERERISKCLLKKFWKFQVNDTNFGSVILVKKYVCIKFMMCEIFVVTIRACVNYFYFCYQNKTFQNLSRMLFVLPKNILLSSRLSNFCASLFPLFSFLGYCWFYRRSWLMINFKVYDIFMSLNWILKTQILYYLVK